MIKAEDRLIKIRKTGILVKLLDKNICSIVWFIIKKESK